MDVSEALQGVSWQRFEQIVVDVLLALGYGGSRAGAGHAFRKSGDGGVDGVINEDRLGLSKIFVQAKRKASDYRVSRPDVQAFVGSSSRPAASLRKPTITPVASVISVLCSSMVWPWLST